MRMLILGTDGYFFLLWNGFLAAIPYVIAVLFERYVGKGARMTGGAWGVFLLWLFFFPNAPYIVTDFVHLPWEYIGSKMFAYDFVLNAAPIVTGTPLWYGLALPSASSASEGYWFCVGKPHYGVCHFSLGFRRVSRAVSPVKQLGCVSQSSPRVS